MPFVMRNEAGDVVAISREAIPGYSEEDLSPEQIGKLLQEAGLEGAGIAGTDQGFIRVLEDLIELLVDKRVILFTELPASAQEKVMHRQKLRSRMKGKLDLIGDDDDL